MQWWEEPQVVEEEWVSAGKKKAAAAVAAAPGGGDRGSSGGGDRATEKRVEKRDPRPIIAPPRRRDGRGMRDRGGRGGGRFERDRPRPSASPTSEPTPSAATPTPTPAPKPTGGPAPVTNVPALKGAWGQPRGVPTPVPAAAPVVEPTPVAAPVPAAEPEVNVLSNSDPTPSGLPPKSAAPSGNVWATRGSAHLIQAEKVKPPEPVVQQVVSEPEAERPPTPPQPVRQEEDLIPQQSQQVDPMNFMRVDSVLPPSVNGANINASGWEPLEMNERLSPTAEPLVMEAPTVAVAPALVEQPVLEQPQGTGSEAKPSVLNMGHWDGGDDEDELDFGFGGFGNDAKEEATAATTATASAQELHTSPARPPPGLSMPPMPTGAILVHELENKLENTTLNAPLNSKEKVEKNDPVATGNASSQPQSFGEPSATGNYPMNQYGAYGMGMYNMNTTNGGFGSMPPGQFPLGGPLGQQQPKQQTLSNQNQRAGTSPVPTGVQPGAPYANQTPSDDQQGLNAGNTQPQPNQIPPGVNQIPTGMQGYPNPAFMYGQYNQMGHPYGMQYGYPAGQGQQFGVQGGFGYHQVMSGGGYGAPYGHDHGNDNHTHIRDNHHNYPKGSGGGGYRHNNRNNHQGGHNNYGNNYQGGNYGGGPYGGNNYQGQYGDQFQRGGYGGSNNPYGMQGGGAAPYPDGGYQNDNDGKGKPKGPRSVQQGFHQQPVGLQSASQNESGGWPSSGPTGQSWGGNWQQDN